VRLLTDSGYTRHATEPDATPQAARDARARAWRFVFECFEKKAGVRRAGDEEKGAERVLPAKRILP
jgi:hypothetical protein